MSLTPLDGHGLDFNLPESPQPELAKEAREEFISMDRLKGIVPSNGAYLTLSDIKRHLGDNTPDEIQEFKLKAIL